MKKHLLLSLLIVSLAFLSGCSDSSNSAEDAGQDTSTDAASDVVRDVVQDVVRDIAKDTRKDVVSDVLLEGGFDVAKDGDDDAPDSDVLPDTNPDVSPDVEPDTVPDAASDAEGDTKDDVEADVVLDSDHDVNADDADGNDGDATLDADAEPCPDTCSSFTLTGYFGAKMITFERAFFGLDLDGDAQGLYLEAYEGGSSTCPEASSPTPRFTLIVSGWPLKNSQVTYDEGLRVTLIDFTGTILNPVPTAKATTATAKRVEACVDCAPWPTVDERDTRVYIDINAQFEGGEIKGQINAPHCDSLDY